MSDPDLKLHADIEGVFMREGGLFDVPVTDLHVNIGRWAIQRNRTHLAHFHVVQVATVQRIYNGRLAYRVQTGPGDFGRPLQPEHLEWLDDHPDLSEVTLQFGDEPVKNCGSGVRLSMRSSHVIRSSDVDAFCALARTLAEPDDERLYVLGVRALGPLP